MNFIQRFLNKKFICPGGFSQVYIYSDGRVMLCDCYMDNKAQIGNLNDNTFDEIWNGEKAIQLRKEILQGEYKYCIPRACLRHAHFNIRFMPKKVSFKTIQSKYPQIVCIGPDEECNVNCIICRPSLIHIDDKDLPVYKEKIEKLYLQILKDAKELTLSIESDPFASRNTKELIKSVVNKYPKIKFNLMTNGILCDKYHFEELGITNKINNIMISLHASNEKIYNEIVKNGNFNKVIQNLEWLKYLKEKRKIKSVILAFVINVKNYKDIPNFIEMTKKYKFEALFWPCEEWERNKDIQNELLNVCSYKHPKFRDFLSVLKEVNFKTKNIHFSFSIEQLKKHL